MRENDDALRTRVVARPPTGVRSASCCCQA